MLRSRNRIFQRNGVRRFGRRAFSLIEIAAAITLTGLLAAVSARFFATAALRSAETAVNAQTLQLELERVRRLAIQTGDPHGLRFQRSAGRVVAIVPYRRTSATSERVIPGRRAVPNGIVMKTKHPAIEFDTEGTTSAGHSVQLQTKERNWQLNVVPVTGMARLQEL